MRTLPFFKPKNKPQFAGLNVSDASSGGGGGDTSSLVNKSDITPIILIGTTNTSGDVISAGTWFYLNGTPCVAKVDIASGATFTEGTNYEEKTIGSALSELNSKSINIDISSDFFTISSSVTHSLLRVGAYANGRLVNFSIMINTNTTIPYSQIGTINSKYVPLLSDVGLNCQGYSASIANGECAILQNQLWGRYTPIDGGVLISGCYLMQ